VQDCKLARVREFQGPRAKSAGDNRAAAGEREGVS
jgi:hypothetical protein